MRAQLAEVYGWTFDTIDSMSFEQIESAVMRGKKFKGIPIDNLEQVAEIAKNWRQYTGI